MPPCEECGFAYAPGAPADRAAHRRRHDVYLHGTLARPLRDDEVIRRVGDLRITLVRPTASFRQRNRVYALARRANWEMRYVLVPYSPRDPANDHALLAYVDGRGIALLILARRDHVWMASWTDTIPPEITDPRPIPFPAGRWTVDFIWILPASRRQGIARALIQEAARFAGVPVPDLAWYTPFSDAGRDLVHSLCPEHFYIGK